MKYIETKTIVEYKYVMNTLRELGYSWENREIDTSFEELGVLDKLNFLESEEETVIFINEDDKLIHYGNIHEVDDDK